MERVKVPSEQRKLWLLRTWRLDDLVLFQNCLVRRSMLVLTLTSSSILLTTIIYAMTFLNRRNRFQVSGLTVIVTGGSQGLGLSLAKLLATKGANVVIVAQTVSKLESALSQIQAVSKPSQRHIYLSYDLRSPDSATQIIEEVTKKYGSPPSVVLNCAGNCQPGFFATTSISTHREQMDTVYWTAAYMSHAALRVWKDTKPRHLIFTCSALAFLPVAGYAAYNPAKAAMRSLADTLNQEVEVYNGAGTNIKVHIAFPMGIQSPGYDNEQKTKPLLTQKLEEDDKPQDPDELARIIVTGLEAGQYTITSNLIGHLMRGWAMGGSQRTSFADYFWSFIGSIVVLFVVPDFMSKCRKWGKEHGANAMK